MVEQIQIPSDIRKKIDYFHWVLCDPKTFIIPKDPHLLPVGIAQGVYNYLAAWISAAERSNEKLEKAVRMLKPNSEREDVKEIITDVFKDVIARLMITGLAQMGKFNWLPDSNSSQNDSSPLFPWSQRKKPMTEENESDSFSIDFGRSSVLSQQ